MKNTLLLVLQAILTVNVLSSQLPTTQMYSLDLQINEVVVLLKNPKFLTSFNLEGYNNQPFFIDENEMLFTSDWNASGLTDIYEFSFKNLSVTRITETIQSEYSPILRTDSTFSVVRQEVTGNDTLTVPQILWEYPLSRSSFGRSLISQYDNIGYFCWLGTDKIALYLLGPPNKLIIYNFLDDSEQFIAYNIGRCLKFDGNQGLYYVQKIGTSASLRRYNLRNEMSQLVTPMLQDQEDYEILNNGDFICGMGSKIYHFSPGQYGKWDEIIDLNEIGVKKITRIAATKDKIVFVDRD